MTTTTTVSEQIAAVRAAIVEGGFGWAVADAEDHNRAELAIAAEDGRPQDWAEVVFERIDRAQAPGSETSLYGHMRDDFADCAPERAAEAAAWWADAYNAWEIVGEVGEDAPFDEVHDLIFSGDSAGALALAREAAQTGAAA